MRGLAIAALLALGCGTSYQAKGLTGGYSERRLNERVFEVTFEGNGYTTRKAAHDGAIRRAADIAMHLGYYGFWVAGQDTDVATSSYTQPVSCTSNAYSTNCTGGNTTNTHRPTSTVVVNMVTWQEAQQAPPGIIVYDARLILAQR